MIQEFRVRNLVYLKTYPDQYEIIKIHDINSTMNVVGFDKRWTAISNIEPIPLTPELLEKAGFVRIKYGWSNKVWKHKDLDYLFFEENEKYLEVYIETQNAPYNERILASLPANLHSFQNFYYALEGKELTINF